MRGARVLAWAAIMLGLGACGGAVPLKEGPGGAPAVAKAQEPLPKADKQRFSVLIAALEGDEDQNGDGVGDISSGLMQAFLTLNRDSFGVEAAGAERSLQVLSTRRVIDDGSARARAWLDETGADRVLWGYVDGRDGKRTPVLYWTRAGASEEGHWDESPGMRIPDGWIKELSTVLFMGALAEACESDQDGGMYRAEQLRPWIEKVEGSLQKGSLVESLGVESRARVRGELGYAWWIYGQQKGERAALEKAEALFKVAAGDFGKKEHPDAWAFTQSSRADVLIALGEQEEDGSKFKDAVALYREVLGVQQRGRVPLAWAAAQNSLGIALVSVGERGSDSQPFKEAVDAFKLALSEYTRERVPLKWGVLQNNLGNALFRLGERESGTKYLQEAADAHKLALLEYTRERNPTECAMILNNLGGVLSRLGERESGTERLKEAVDVFKLALSEVTRERDPLEWGAMQSNLGHALHMLGERESGTQHLEEAAEVFQLALLERTRERDPMKWAATQAGLGLTLALLGQREGGVLSLHLAVGAFQRALVEYTEDKSPDDWQRLQDNIKLAQSLIDERAPFCISLPGRLVALKRAKQSKSLKQIEQANRAVHEQLAGLHHQDLGRKPACLPPISSELWSEF